MKKFNIHDGRYVRVSFLDMILVKENTNMKLTFNDEGQLLAYDSGKKLSVQRFYCHLSVISI